MGSIPKIVSIPLKWASKQVLDRTLLRFPGGDSHDPIACTYCPEMCRFSCPTAVASGNDAVTPCNKMSLLHLEKRWPGQAAQGGELWPIYDCTGCGRCTEYCKYGMPVQKRLFEAREKFGWTKAREAAAALTDKDDPLGDLADELGDRASSDRRLKASVARAKSLRLEEPRSLFFAVDRGMAAEWSLKTAVARPPGARELGKLGGKRWLLHESVWLSRRLERAEEVLAWARGAGEAGARIELPFQHGRDCIDSGGEGAYPLLFPDQARRMALDFWERDRHRAEGILCVSARAARHLRASLDKAVEILSLGELLSTERKKK